MSSDARALTLLGSRAVDDASAAGSPIVREDGRAVGLVIGGTLVSDRRELMQKDQPVLLANLPGWLLAEIRQ